jgi:hypothetical protein
MHTNCSGSGIFLFPDSKAGQAEVKDEYLKEVKQKKPLKSTAKEHN